MEMLIPKLHVMVPLAVVLSFCPLQANLRQAVKENQVMEAAIIKVDKSRFELKLSLRKSDTLPNPDKVGGRNYIE